MRVIFNFDDNYEENDDAVKTEEVDGKTGRFDKVFSEDKIIDIFARASAAIMYISTVTGISLDEVFDMWTTKMKEELNAEDTKSLLEVGKLINKFFDGIKYCTDCGKENRTWI